jgi:hypothetical protein
MVVVLIDNHGNCDELSLRRHKQKFTQALHREVAATGTEECQLVKL